MSSASSSPNKQKNTQEFKKHKEESSASKKERNLSFAHKLINHFDAAKGQVKTGLRSLKATSGLIRQFATLQSNFSRSVHTLVAKEASSKGASTDDGLSTVHKSSSLCRDAINAYGATMFNLSVQLVKELCDPLDAFIAGSNNKRKLLTQQHRVCVAEVNELNQSVVRERHNCEKLIAAAISARNAESNNNKVMENKEAGLGMWLGAKLSSKVSQITGSTHEELKRKAHKSSLKYTKLIRKANKRQAKFLMDDLPKILDRLQWLEMQRVNMHKVYMSAFVDLISSFDVPSKELFLTFQDHLTTIKSEVDLQGFIERTLDQGKASPSPIVNTHKYLLNISPEDIKQGRLYRSPYSQFGRSLASILKSQYEKDPPDTLRVPRCMFTLIRYCYLFGGMQEEGLFRVQAPADEIEVLYDHVEPGSFPSPLLPSFERKFSAHTPAVILKRWLRQLPDQIIPPRLYEPALKLASSSSSSSSSSSFSFDAEWLEFFSKLPNSSQAVIMHLACLCRDVVANIEHTRMSYQSLGVVLGPCVIAQVTADPAASARNAKVEAMFVAKLLQGVPEEWIENVRKERAADQEWANQSLSLQQQPQHQQPLDEKKDDPLLSAAALDLTTHDAEEEEGAEEEAEVPASSLSVTVDAVLEQLEAADEAHNEEEQPSSSDDGIEQQQEPEQQEAKEEEEEEEEDELPPVSP